jgi:hypothetical protein
MMDEQPHSKFNQVPGLLSRRKRKGSEKNQEIIISG